MDSDTTIDDLTGEIVLDYATLVKPGVSYLSRDAKTAILAWATVRVQAMEQYRHIESHVIVSAYRRASTLIFG